MNYKPVILSAALLTVFTLHVPADIRDSSDPDVAAQRQLRERSAKIRAGFDAALVAIENEAYVEADVAPLWLKALTAKIKGELIDAAKEAEEPLPPATAEALARAQTKAARDRLAADGKLSEAYQAFFAALKRAKNELLAKDRSRVEAVINGERKVLDNKQKNGEIGRIAHIIFAWRGKAAMTETGFDRMFVKAYTDISIADLLRYAPQGGRGSTVSVALRDAQNLAGALAKVIPPTRPVEVPLPGGGRTEVPPTGVLGPAGAVIDVFRRR